MSGLNLAENILENALFERRVGGERDIAQLPALGRRGFTKSLIRGRLDGIYPLFGMVLFITHFAGHVFAASTQVK